MEKGGALIVIGGHEDKTKGRIILARFAEMAGGQNARVVVIATPGAQGETMKKTCEDALGQCGVKQVCTLPVHHREEANNHRNAAKILNATGILITGGAQNRLMTLLGGSDVEAALNEAFVRGAVIAGSSAGGAALSETMVTSLDRCDRLDAARGMLKLGVGLGFLHGMVMDTHFAARDRIYRLLATVTANPGVLGIGIDENTAMVIQPGNSLEVIGEGAITILDARNVAGSNVQQMERDDPLSVFGAQLHVIASGFSYHLAASEGYSQAHSPSCLVHRMIGTRR